MTIRQVTPDDVAAIHAVNEAAFGREVEAELVDKLRSRGVLTVSLFTVRDGEIVGHITFSSVIMEYENSGFEAISLARMAVIPAYQRRGIGSQMVRGVSTNASVSVTRLWWWSAAGATTRVLDLCPPGRWH